MTRRYLGDRTTQCFFQLDNFSLAYVQTTSCPWKGPWLDQPWKTWKNGRLKWRKKQEFFMDRFKSESNWQPIDACSTCSKSMVCASHRCDKLQQGRQSWRLLSIVSQNHDVLTRAIRGSCRDSWVAKTNWRTVTLIFCDWDSWFMAPNMCQYYRIL